MFKKIREIIKNLGIKVTIKKYDDTSDTKVTELDVLKSDAKTVIVSQKTTNVTNNEETGEETEEINMSDLIPTKPVSNDFIKSIKEIIEKEREEIEKHIKFSENVEIPKEKKPEEYSLQELHKALAVEHHKKIDWLLGVAQGKFNYDEKKLQNFNDWCTYYEKIIAYCLYKNKTHQEKQKVEEKTPNSNIEFFNIGEEETMKPLINEEEKQEPPSQLNKQGESPLSRLTRDIKNGAKDLKDASAELQESQTLLTALFEALGKAYGNNPEIDNLIKYMRENANSLSHSKETILKITNEIPSYIRMFKGAVKELQNSEKEMVISYVQHTCNLEDILDNPRKYITKKDSKQISSNEDIEDAVLVN